MSKCTHLKLIPSAMPRVASRSLSLVVAGAVLLSIGVGAPALADKKEEKAQMLVERATATVDMFASDPRFTYFYDGYLKTAKGFLVIPSMAKGGFVVGGSKGRGVLIAKDVDSEDWNGPAFYTLGGASIGLQAGGKSSEILMIVTSDRGLNRLLNSGAKLGGDLSVAVGNLGEGMGSADVRADIIAFSRSKGFFGGASLEGSIVNVSQSRNQAYYGETLMPSDILVRGRGENEGADGLVGSVETITTIDHSQAASPEDEAGD